MKQTAIEWLLEQLVKGDFEQQQIAIKQAIEIEKEQIVDAYIKGNYKSNSNKIWKKEWAEQYYNETFKK